MNEGQKQVKGVHSAGTNQELIERYAKWANEYESDMIQGLGYTMPEDAGRMFARHVPQSARVLDAGAGTGLVGQALAELGYRDIVAMDMSADMLAEAERKGVYVEYHQMVLGEPLGFATDSFDATISIGTFTVGHAPAHALGDLVRVTRPDGHIVFSLPEHLGREGEFKEQHDALVAEGRWRLVEVTQPFSGLPKGDTELLYQYWAFQVTTAS